MGLGKGTQYIDIYLKCFLNHGIFIQFRLFTFPLNFY